MPHIPTSAKKVTIITLSADVLTEAKALGINISQTCDQFLRELVRDKREQRGNPLYLLICNAICCMA